VAHIYANDQGLQPVPPAGKLYALDGGTFQKKGSGEYEECDTVNGKRECYGNFSNVFVFDYGAGYTIKYFHVAGTRGGPHNGQTLQPDPTDRNGHGFRIGYIGGLGGRATGTVIITRTSNSA
jgi:hypothetical protein